MMDASRNYQLHRNRFNGFAACCFPKFHGLISIACGQARSPVGAKSDCVDPAMVRRGQSPERFTSGRIQEPGRAGPASRQ